MVPFPNEGPVVGGIVPYHRPSEKFFGIFFGVGTRRVSIDALVVFERVYIKELFISEIGN